MEKYIYRFAKNTNSKNSKGVFFFSNDCSRMVCFVGLLKRFRNFRNSLLHGMKSRKLAESFPEKLDSLRKLQGFQMDRNVILNIFCELKATTYKFTTCVNMRNGRKDEFTDLTKFLLSQHDYPVRKRAETIVCFFTIS